MISVALARCRTLRGPRRQGFTLVELLVVIGIISILAGLLLPAIIYALGTADLANCLSNLRQMGQAFTNYYKDFDSWMVSCGAPETISNSYPQNGPFVEPPMDLEAVQVTLGQGRFPSWYVALATYVNPAATWKNAVNSYCLSEGKPTSPLPDSYYIHREIAKICMLYTCPAKKQATLGYGYNYAAAFGESVLYPFDKVKYVADYPSYACRGAKNGGSAVKDAAQDQFCWPYGAASGGTDPSGFFPYPCFLTGGPAPLPIMWYGQSASFGVLTQPTAQIAVCDTGLVTNAPVWEKVVVSSSKGVDRYDWGPSTKKSPPAEWTEFTTNRAANNEHGYVRFPLSKIYTGDALVDGSGNEKPWKDIVSLRVARYKKLYSQYTDSVDGSETPSMNTGWRPMPRHNRKTACLYFDGRAMPHNINDIVNYEWGDRNCLFDNRPAGKAPAPKFEDTYSLGLWLPSRVAGTGATAGEVNLTQ